MKNVNGFLYKDLCLLRNGMKAYAILFAVFFVLTLLNIYDLSFMFVFCSVFTCTSGIGYMAADEQIKWDRFAVATPNGRTKVVRDKYRFVLLMAGGTLVLELAAALLFLLLGHEKILSTLMICVGGIGGSLFINALSLPLMFYFGSQKGRTIAVGVTALLAGGLASLAVIVALMLHGNDQRFLVIAVVLAALAAVALPISYKVSMRIYSKKEF